MRVLLATLAIGLGMSSCAIQDEVTAAYEVTHITYSSPGTVDVYSRFPRTDLYLTDSEVQIYTPGEYNKLTLTETYAWTDVTYYGGNSITIQLSDDSSVTYLLFNLNNHYE
jgi:hypothetical protein